MRHGIADLGMLVGYWYTADPSACLDRYLHPARKVFNFGKRKKSQGAGLVNKEGVVKLLPSLFAKKKKKKKCNNGRRMGWGIIM